MPRKTAGFAVFLILFFNCVKSLFTRRRSDNPKAAPLDPSRC